MSRHAVAAELQRIIEEAQRLMAEGERLATSSGMLAPTYFRGASAALTMAAGELHRKGLLQPHVAPSEPVVG